MRKVWRRFARAREASRGSPESAPGGGRHRCVAEEPPWDRSGLEQVVEQATYMSGRMSLHLAPRFEGGAPLSFAKRRDGAPCHLTDCPYAFVLAVPLHSRESAERQARRQLKPGAMRWFVELRLASACVMSCEELTQIDERKLRDADPTANATLRLLREAGADVLLIRGERSRRTAVVFRQAVGPRVQVVDEAAATLQQDGTWVREALEPAGAPDRWLTLLPRPWCRDRSRLGRVAWELALALVCFLLAPPIAAVAGATLTVPVWAELLLGAAAAGTAAMMTWRALAPVRAEIARVPEQPECFERLAPARKPEPHREVMDAFGEGRTD